LQVINFSGQQPFEKMNSGIKICSADIHKAVINLESNQGQMKYQAVKDNTLIEGRKNFAISISDGVVHVSGGVNSKGR
jgi:hypothetical protein